MTPTTLNTLAALDAALDGLARALATGRSSDVLAAEEPLARAVGRLVAIKRRDVHASLELRHAIHRAQLALQRCRRLGQSAAEFAQAALPPRPYTRTGLHVVVPVRHSISSRT